nr:non-functional pseudokinase ZED1-like [Quercus suber]
MRWSWFMPYHFFIKRIEERKQRERAFYENGSLLLEKLIASCNAKPIPIRTFSPQQLLLATNNYSSELLGCYWGYWYKGSLEGRIVLIKHLQYVWADKAINDLAISAQMSGHSNVLKPIGCCLHTPISLFYRIYVSPVTKRQHEPMMWERRLKIARQIAHALSYLHTAFPRPVIHMNMDMRSILLNEHDVPKLSDFYFSVSIPEGEADVDAPFISNFRSPEFKTEGKVTEKADVYDFGRILLELLTGECSREISRLTIDKDSSLVAYIHNRAQGSCINEIVDPAILAEDGEGGATLEHQLQAVVDLGLTCTEEDPQTRPTMVDVTKQLRRIERFAQTGEVLLGNLQNLKLHESFEEHASASLKRNASSDEIQAVNEASERPLEVSL